MILGNESDDISYDEVCGHTKANEEQTALPETFINLSLRDAREQFEKEYLLTQINRFGGNVTKTAQFVGMERSALHRKLKLLNLGGDDNHG